MSRARPLVIGHRGASGYRPEHTAAAYALAFAQGADAVEPDLVLSGDGVLVLRHENEISATTDIAARPEFVDRRTVKTIDGLEVEGWFTEDFSWEELRTIRTRERRPDIRPGSAAFDGRYGMLSFPDLLGLVERESVARGRPLGVVAELKHPSHFAAQGHSLVTAYRRDLARYGWSGRDPRLVTECFEPSALGELAATADGGRLVRLVEAAPELAEVGASGAGRDGFSDARLREWSRTLDGISLERSLVLDAEGRSDDIVSRAHSAGLLVFCWTLRPENRYLTPAHRHGGGVRSWGDWRTEWRRILATGVDGVFADHPDLIVSLLG